MLEAHRGTCKFRACGVARRTVPSIRLPGSRVTHANKPPNDATGGTIGTTQYNTWRAHFGQPAGSGAGAIATAPVPEPPTLLSLMFAAAGCSLQRRRAAWRVSKLVDI